MKNLRFFGDSITAGVTISPAYPELLAASLGVSVAGNYASSGHQAMDQSNVALYNGANVNTDTIIQLGANDVDQKPNTSTQHGG